MLVYGEMSDFSYNLLSIYRTWGEGGPSPAEKKKKKKDESGGKDNPAGHPTTMYTPAGQIEEKARRWLFGQAMTKKQVLGPKSIGEKLFLSILAHKVLGSERSANQTGELGYWWGWKFR